MKFSKTIVVAVFAAVLLSLQSCGTMRRLGKDLYVAVTSPVLIPMAAGSDAYSGAVEVRKGYQGGAFTEVVSMPFLFLWHGIKHTLCVGVHVLDVALTPIYGISELSEFGPEIQPLDYYQNTWFDRTPESSTDAESGEAGKGK